MLNVQNTQEQLPDIEQQHTPPSLSSTMQPSDGPDRPVCRGEIVESNIAMLDPRPWERDSKGLRFLYSQRVCTHKLLGGLNDWVVSAAPEVLMFTISPGLIIYNTERKTFRQIKYGFPVNPTSAAHNLSPDGNTLIRWIFNEENQTSKLVAIDVSSKKKIAVLQRNHQFQQSDILNAIWVDDFTIYIPVSADGVIIPWNTRDAPYQYNDSEVLTVPELHPSILKFAITKNRLWWIATGITFDPPSGLIVVHDMENDESRIVEGMVSCIAEVEVDGEEKALVVSAGVTHDYKLQLCVQQLNPHSFGRSFSPVDVNVDMIEERDYPRDILVSHPSSIVVVMTAKFYSYFFELNSGAYLYSEAQESYRLCPGQFDKRKLFLWSHKKSDIQVLTINEGNLIGYCRKVLKDDGLASAIARRTGLSEAEDIIPDTM
ncbi:hypothetical protein FRC02_003058 [Tulasnella sp. 418]|nr:hypothetical protein FRC02_003058 [Tulasnella sp. 418]